MVLYDRVLCGRRKGNILLLGCPWSQELDSDSDASVNPVTNPSCLVRTVQRALLAQALLKLPVQSDLDYESGQVQYSCAGLVHLGEVHYHRPQEEIRGRTYPEQVTTLLASSLLMERFTQRCPQLRAFTVTAVQYTNALPC